MIMIMIMMMTMQITFLVHVVVTVIKELKVFARNMSDYETVLWLSYS